MGNDSYIRDDTFYVLVQIATVRRITMDLEEALKMRGVAGCHALVELQTQGVHCLRLDLREKEIVQQAIVELDDRLKTLESHSAANAPQDDSAVMIAYESFLSAFELVFDNDWDMTKGCISNSTFISERGTFLAPEVDDENNNWANRGALLAAYRHLKDVLKKGD